MLYYGTGNGVGVFGGPGKQVEAYTFQALRPPHTSATYFKRYMGSKTNWRPMAIGTETEGGEAVNATVNATGVEATSAIGVEQAAGTANAALTGIEATSSIGTEEGAGTANAEATGLEALSAIGAEDAAGTANAPATGIEATSAIGTEDVAGTADAVLTGIEATSAIGDETVTATGTATHRPRVISVREFLEMVPAWDFQGDAESPKPREAVNASVGVSLTPVSISVGKVTVSAEARHKVIHMKRMSAETSAGVVKIDYTSKMRKQEEEFVKVFLMAA